MINLTDENVLTLAEATTYLPRRRKGKKPHVSCLYRWATSGCNGIVLETLKVGCTTCTSEEALQRFCERLTTGDASPQSQPTKGRQRARDKADRELASAGI